MPSAYQGSTAITVVNSGTIGADVCAFMVVTKGDPKSENWLGEGHGYEAIKQGSKHTFNAKPGTYQIAGAFCSAGTQDVRAVVGTGTDTVTINGPTTIFLGEKGTPEPNTETLVYDKNIAQGQGGNDAQDCLPAGADAGGKPCCSGHATYHEGDKFQKCE